MRRPKTRLQKAGSGGPSLGKDNLEALVANHVLLRVPM